MVRRYAFFVVVGYDEGPDLRYGVVRFCGRRVSGGLGVDVLWLFLVGLVRIS